MDDTQPERRLAIEIGASEAKFLWVEDGASAAKLSDKCPIAAYTTFTDLLLDFSRRSGRPLAGVDCAIVIPGAAQGDSIPVARGKWTISRSGLAAMFKKPVQIINDVGAIAWATLDIPGAQLTPFGTARAPKFSSRGRWVVIWLDEGVGMAAIDIAEDGSVRVIECEAGHAGFSPGNAEEELLHRELRARYRHVSWEHVITLDATDPVWAKPGMALDHAARLALKARVIGSFAGDAVLSLGAWDGAILTGKLTAELATGNAKQLFAERYEDKEKFRRLMREAPCWHLKGNDLALAGAAVALKRR